MKKFGLIGENVSYSLSPFVHSYIYKHLNIQAEYSLISITKQELPDKIGFLKTLDGFNVTQPHKNSIIKYLDDNFSSYSAVNTVVNENGRLYGYNTDEYGFRKHISQMTEIKGKKALIIGAGGMAEIAADVLILSGADVCIINRTHSKAEEIAKKTGAKAIPAAKGESYGIVVNCSSQGLFEKDFNLPEFDYEKTEFAYDTIYFDTAFSKFFSSKNIRTANGLKFLIYQAIKTEEVFLNVKIENKAALCEEIERAIKHKDSV